MGCGALATLALRNPDHCEMIVKHNGPEVVAKVMQLHSTKEKVQVRLPNVQPMNYLSDIPIYTRNNNCGFCTFLSRKPPA